jgi:hypothetical protein
MNISVSTAALAGAAPAKSSLLLSAAHQLLPYLEQGRIVDAACLRAAMTSAFKASDADGAWDWKSAYDACEAAQLLFLRKFGAAMRASARSVGVLLGMLDKLARLVPSHTRRSEESEALQQFSTPVALGFAATFAAQLRPDDLVLEPSAGTGLLAIFAELVGSQLVLNELADARFALLKQLFADFSVTQCDAERLAKLKASFGSYLDALRDCPVRSDQFAAFARAVLSIRIPDNLAPRSREADDWRTLMAHLTALCDRYMRELGGNAYAVLNVITEFASHPPQNRHLRRERNSLQRLAGTWLSAFAQRCRQPAFDFNAYVTELTAPNAETAA